MAIKGSLKEASLADVCQLLALGQKTGSLSIADRSRFGQIYFDKGRITFARVVNRRDRIGDLLVRDGVLTQDQLTAALEAQNNEPDKKLGQLLISGGFLAEQELQLYIRLQIEEAIYHLFTWSRGNFFFEADEMPEADITVSINPESLLLEAARRVDEWSQIEKKIPSLDLVFEVEHDRLASADIELKADQRKIAELFDGTRSVQEVADETNVDEFEVGRILYGLIQAGYAHRVERKKVAETDLARGRDAEIAERRNLGVAFYRASMWEDAAREFQRVLELNESDFDARFHLALVSLRAEKYREALRQMKALLEETGPNFAVFINMAYALRRLGRPNDALLVLSEADAIKPHSAAVALSRGVAYLEAGDLADALQSFKAYSELVVMSQTAPAIYYYYAALAYAISGDLTQADQVITEGLGVHGAAAPLLLLAGAIAERRNELTLAERYYRQVVDEDANLVHAHKNLGDVAYKRSVHDEAAEHYRRAIGIAPDFGDDVYAKLGNIAYKAQRRDEAMRYWQRSLELNPDNQVVKNNLDIVAGAAAV
jgi:tetratricopeptide (TPR) repeat protein